MSRFAGQHEHEHELEDAHTESGRATQRFAKIDCGD